MPDFIVNESRFVVDMEEHRGSYLSIGEILPCGIKIAERSDSTDTWQLFISEDSRYNILAVKPELAERWVQEGYLPKRAFTRHFEPWGEIDLLISPASLVLQRLTAVRFYGSARYARSLAGALWFSRSLDHEVNLRDAIYCELFSVLLPGYTLTRPVADRALFENCLRKDNVENLASPEEMEDPGLSPFAFREACFKAGIKLGAEEPYLQAGEIVDEFVNTADPIYITSTVEVRENYQICSTNSDVYVLLMEMKWANQLFDHGLLEQMDISAIQVGGTVLKALAFSKRKAVEALDSRHFGMNKDDVIELAQAIARTRRMEPSAVLDKGLYVQELGLILPEQFEGGSRDSDGSLIRKIAKTGPFAMAPFLRDHIEDAVLIAKRA